MSKHYAYYNEIDPYMAQWLRNLMAGGHIMDGVVDERSIEDVVPDDVEGFLRCHFYAGAGVWDYSLRLARFPEDVPVWTGSCPCQPFSTAGKGGGFADERHLWPAWNHLISECRPSIVFGEQVASKAVDAWIDLVQSDLEGLGYAFGCVPFPSSGVGAPHIRDRSFWVADAAVHGHNWATVGRGVGTGEAERRLLQPEGCGTASRLADSDNAGRRPDSTGGNERNRSDAGREEGSGHAEVCGEFGRLADPDEQQRNRSGNAGKAGRGESANCGSMAKRQPIPDPTNGFWRDADWLFCRDGRWRPVEPGLVALVDGSAGSVGRVRADQGHRAGRLKGYGNAINAIAAKTFIEAYMESVS